MTRHIRPTLKYTILYHLYVGYANLLMQYKQVPWLLKEMHCLKKEMGIAGNFLFFMFPRLKKVSEMGQLKFIYHKIHLKVNFRLVSINFRRRILMVGVLLFIYGHFLATIHLSWGLSWGHWTWSARFSSFPVQTSDQITRAGRTLKKFNFRVQNQ